MTFWGAEISVMKPFTLEHEVHLGRLHISHRQLHISQATWLCGSGTCTVECKVGNKSPIFLCALIPDVRENYHLELEFDESQEVVFSVVGLGVVYLSGYYVGGSGPDLAATYQETSRKLNLAPKVKASGMKNHSFTDDVIIHVLAAGESNGKIVINEKMVYINYSVRLKNRKIFDSTVPGKRPYHFRVGTGQVIKGLDVGVMGMRVGEKRKLTIPPSYGYGDKQIEMKDNRVGRIPPNSSLIFYVELVAVD